MRVAVSHSVQHGPQSSGSFPTRWTCPVRAGFYLLGKEACGIAAPVSGPRSPGLNVQSDQMITGYNPRTGSKQSNNPGEGGGWTARFCSTITTVTKMPSSKALNLRLLHLKWSVADSTWLTQQASLRCVSVCACVSVSFASSAQWIQIEGEILNQCEREFLHFHPAWRVLPGFKLLWQHSLDFNLEVCSNLIWSFAVTGKKKQGSNESLERRNERVFFSLKHNSFCQGVPEEGTYCKAPWLDGSSQVWMGKQLKLSLKPVIVWKGGVGGRRPALAGCEGTALAWLARRLCGWGVLR